MQKRKDNLILEVIKDLEIAKCKMSKAIEERVHDQEFTDYLTPSQVLKILDISRPTLYKYTNEGILIKYQIGNKSFYRKTEILNSLTNRNVENIGI
ncbi:MAG: helix-turn-helix domain-containing protein [Saprospiraceae bacterium]|nr:helix-turn-helix domain-containing protein [Saprospiraceae bacterium]